MPVTSVESDTEALTMSLVADFPVGPERLWAVFTDPRQLERFWGPPGWPATFDAFDFSVGGHAKYHMTSPQGQHAGGAWEFTRIDEPRGFEVIDSFADDNGDPIEGMPSMRMVFSFEATPEGSRLTNVSHFASAEALEQVVAMGAVEGSTLAMNQLDAVLLGLREFAQGTGTQLEVLSDQHVRITRLIDGPRELVWRAHVDPDLMRQWMLGPDGWRMTVSEVDVSVGGRYRLAWEPEAGTEGEGFGFDGETLLIDEPRRIVQTEHMTGTEYPSTTNDLSFYEEDGATLVTLLIEYPDAATRDAVLSTGMVDGMEQSFERMERVVLA
ncbi:SRPBCC domain-containing protein [Microbacterium sp. CFBP 13617]|uniref:SRPBCC family protein n=1 Tax=Microbacterium sp. CFBP 13617 TaxID=2774035 RepID=UPI00178722F4|nr:SRPBCC family protein [Microbacterium sp. CFBP 13617]MBD8217279.1 SRPBCC domain-containing protein [Microbacterium sp. CFBP 13617]